MTFFQTNFGQIWEMFGVLKPFLWHFGQLFPTKRSGGIYYREYSIHLATPLHRNYCNVFMNSVSATYPHLVCERVKELNYMSHSHKKNMSCQACSMFEPNSDYIWERHVLKLLADGQVVFSKVFNFLHYLLEGIGSKWVKCYWGTYMKNSFYNLCMLPI